MKKVLLFLLCAVLLAVGVIGVPMGLYGEYQEYKDYTENGYTVKCTVTGFLTTGKHTSIDVVYEDEDGRSHSAVIERPGSAAPSVGSTMTAYLMPDSPDEPWVKPDAGDMILLLVLSGILFFVGVSMPFVFVGIGKENKLLDAEGKPVTGTIIDVKSYSSGGYVGAVYFETERGEERAYDVPLKKNQVFGDDIEMVYAYDKKGKIHWRLK